MRTEFNRIELTEKLLEDVRAYQEAGGPDFEGAMRGELDAMIELAFYLEGFDL